jgi:phage terminase large subunit
MGPELPTEALDRYLVAARDAGCPRDQVENFLRANVVLQPRQLLASAAARLCDKPDGPTKIAYGGARGGGKSHWGLAQVACDDCQRFPGLKFLYLRMIGKSGKEAIQDLRREVLHSTPHECTSEALSFPNGSKIILGHFLNDRDVNRYLGLQYDGALIEEATQLTTRKIEDIGTCVRTSKPGWRPRQYLTTNPGGVGHAWFRARFVAPARKHAETLTRFIQATVRDNAFVNPEYLSDLERLTGWKRRAWLDGDWDIAAGQFFTTWRHEKHVISGGAIPEHWRVWLGFDYGFTHYTAVLLFCQDGDGNIYVVDEHAERRWLPERHARGIRSMLDRHGVAEHRLMGIFAGNDVFAKKQDGGTIADDYAELGLKLMPANDDRINGAAEVLARLGDFDADPIITPTVWISERCARLIECLPGLEHDPHRPEDVLKIDADENGIGGDDTYDAFRYGLMAVTRPKGRKPRAGGTRQAIQGYKAA